MREDSRAASERNFVSQKSMTFDLAVLLKEDLVGGFNSKVNGSVMEYLAHRSLTCRNQERDDLLEVDRVLRARRWRIFPGSRREIIPNKFICRSSKRPVRGRLPPRK